TTADHPQLSYFQNWDGHLGADSVAAALYGVLRRELLCCTFRDLAPRMLDLVLGHGIDEFVVCSSFLFGHGSSLLLRLLDDVSSRDQGGAILGEAFRRTTDWLREHLGNDPSGWQWGRLHQVRFAHPLGEAPLLQQLFNLSRGPYPIGGDVDTIA